MKKIDNLDQIVPGTFVWNRWDYSIMGRDTGTATAIFKIETILSRDENRVEVNAFSFEKMEQVKHYFDKKDCEHSHAKFCEKGDLEEYFEKKIFAEKKSILEIEEKLAVRERALEKLRRTKEDALSELA